MELTEEAGNVFIPFIAASRILLSSFLFTFPSKDSFSVPFSVSSYAFLSSFLDFYDKFFLSSSQNLYPTSFPVASKNFFPVSFQFIPSRVSSKNPILVYSSTSLFFFISSFPFPSQLLIYFQRWGNLSPSKLNHIKATTVKYIDLQFYTF